MIKIQVERKPVSNRAYWCQACDAKQSRTVSIVNSDVQSMSFHLCNDCLKELADKIQQELNTTKTFVVSNFTVCGEMIIRMYLEQFDVEINDDDDKLTITYKDDCEGSLINDYLDYLAKVVNIKIERK